MSFHGLPQKLTGLWRLLTLALLPLQPAAAAEPLPPQLNGIDVTEHLGAQLDLSLTFVDWQGRTVRLADIFRGDKPVLLSLNYYECPMMCGIQLQALTQSLAQFEWTAGKQFRLLTISFDPKEGAELAAGKRKSILEAYGRDKAEWSFWVDKDDHAKALADALGFGFRYDPVQKQYAHPIVLFVLSPSGRISRYLYGIEYPPRDLKFALLEAADGKTGGTVERVILSCFHYVPSSGRYELYALGLMRLMGIVTVILIAVMLAIFWRRELKSREAQEVAPKP
jgi:protein SCO1/2